MEKNAPQVFGTVAGLTPKRVKEITEKIIIKGVTSGVIGPTFSDPKLEYQKCSELVHNFF
jgi:hypothetical protein